MPGHDDLTKSLSVEFKIMESSEIVTPQLRGIIPPLVTPLVDRDTLDVVGLERLIEHVLAGGVHGLFVLGTTGEGPALGSHLRYQFVEMVCDQVAGRVPVLVGVSDPAFTESLELAQHAHGAGAAAVVTAGPYYLPLSQSELFNSIEMLSVESPLPVVLYNMPACTDVMFELDTVRELIHVPNLLGMKDSSGDMEYFRELGQLTSDLADFALLIGPETQLVEAMQLGADGGVTGGANMAPRLFVDLYEAALAGDAERCAALQRRTHQIAETIYTVGQDPSRFIKGTKCGLAAMGICDDFVLPPYGRFSDGDREQIAGFVDQLQLKEVTSEVTP